MKNFLRILLGSKAPQASPLPPPTLADIENAANRIKAFVPRTPMTYSLSLSEQYGIDVYLKWDNRLRTGSFKERGACNFLLTLDEAERSRGVCAASAGNHALALSRYAGKLNIPCTLVMPRFAPLVKVESSRRNGASIILHGSTFNEAFDHAEKLAKDRGLVFIPPYDHPLIIAGQGVTALEVLDEIEDIDAVVAPIGGGGLMSGIATVFKERHPETYVLGVCSEWAVQARMEEASSPSALTSSTIADGIAVKRVGACTAPILDKYVDKIVTASEMEIASALIKYLEAEHTVVEGAGAAALIALMRNELPDHCKRIVIFVSGSNIDPNMLSRLIERDMGEKGQLLRLIASIPDRPGSLSVLTRCIADSGANVLQVLHDRSYTKVPGNVDVTLMLEVRNLDHKNEIMLALSDVGISSRAL